ncbi:MAG: GWxTD domain-containing protein [Ignavibacteriae bacterium]|nr:GWxTD domain-containing protein [Ignavibacteriota bacterium]NOG99678.1 GWxTD domain-containing protein [Ignavibacteriota bacterium]
MIKFLIVFFVSFAAIFAQVEQSRAVNPYSIGPDFYIELANYKGDLPGKTRVDVFIQVPYKNVSFIRAENGYTAEYSITLTFYTEDKEDIIYESLWNEKISVDNFELTESKRGQNLSYRKSHLTPGKYLLNCAVEDLNSNRNVVAESIVNIKEFDDPVELSDIVLVAKRIETENTQSIIPNVSKTVSEDFENLDFFFEVYSDKERKLFVEYSIEDKNEQRTFTEMVHQDIAEGTNLINHVIENPNISLGDYSLYVKLIEENDNELTSVRKKISSKLPGFPAIIKDLETAVSQMQYIASNEEMNYIEEAENYTEMLQRFKDFWKAKDPSPNTPENEVLTEYYRRVAYATKNFESYYDGWKTDMGMIYITLGPPNQVDRHPFDYDSKPYEVWDYYQLNRRFVFVDQTGFGDYRLLDRDYGDWNRYRY